MSNILYVLVPVLVHVLVDRFRTWSALLAGFWDFLAKALHFLSVKYLTGLLQSLAVTTYAAYVGTTRLCNNPELNIMLLRWVPLLQNVLKFLLEKLVPPMGTDDHLSS